MRDLIQRLYFGTDPVAVRARFVLIFFDIAAVIFFVVTTFMEYHDWILVVDFVIGAVLTLDLIARTSMKQDKLGFLLRPWTILDGIVIVSLFLPALTESFLFLRVLRTLRLLRSYYVMRELRERWPWLRANEEIVFAALNLVVFVFVVAALVFSLQTRVNPSIANYVDALYFTVTTLTTTGFGDITLVGQTGRMLSVVIMFIGVGLFLRLLQAVFRPAKVDHECPDCGLSRHDKDAVHCKHCGHILHIRTEGD